LEEGCVTLDMAVKEVVNSSWRRVLMGGLEEGYAKKVERWISSSTRPSP